VTESISKKWALILGVSSGFGAAAGIALARAGFNIIGVHLDRRATMPNAEKILAAIQARDRQALFFNANAADPDRRAEIIGACRKAVEPGPEGCGIGLLLHSLAFGTLKPYISQDPTSAIKSADMSMTLDVMANSLVYWTQDLLQSGLLKQGSKIFAMTSAGSHRVWPTYGAVSAAKAALESHVRQLAVELAGLEISVNAIQAGVTDTPAARRIPGSDQMFARALESNPAKRLTKPEDVAEILVAFAMCESTWATGNIIRVDGGEDLV